MKITRQSLILLLASFFIQSCFPGFDHNNFQSFSVYLHNNSPKKDCVSDSIHVTFVIKNVSNTTSDEIKIDVPAGEVKFANINGTKDEYINVKLLNSADSSLILEEKIKIGKSVVVGGDVATRAIAYCNNSAFKLTNFGN